MSLLRRNLVVGVLVFLTVIMAAGSVVGAHLDQEGDPPDPQPGPRTGIGWLDSIYYGATPPHSDERPVLVFVHGLGGLAEDWWTGQSPSEVNDMYVTAYREGYRTAFVSLNGPERRPAKSMWDNGLVLSLQLEAIARHYGVDQVDIVGHSKGGVDLEAAIAYYGGSEHVRNAFTLGTPHRGTELADLAYDESAEWLAALLGLLDEGTYSMQTGYMQYFRALTDGRSEHEAVDFFVGAGTDIGSPLSVLWFGGQYLSQFGPSDGFVTVTSTQLPGATTLFVQPYNHYNIFWGRKAFPWIHAVLRRMPIIHTIFLPFISADTEAGRVSEALPVKPYPSSGMERPLLPAALESGVILRGGRLTGSVTESVPIEPDARTAVFDLLVSEEDVTAALTGPDGISHTLQLTTDSGGGLFGPAPHQVYVATQPEAGVWTIRMKGPPGAAYLLVTTVDSPLRVALRGLPEELITPGTALMLSASADDLSGRPTVSQIEAHVNRTLPGRIGKHRMAEKSTSGAILAKAPSGEGIYVASVTVAGETSNGMPFERSFVRSFAVVKPETLRGGPTLLDK